MSRLYVIVQTNKSEHNKTSMVTCDSDKDVISRATYSTVQSKDNIVIKRIFSVDEYGNIAHHEITFEGGKLSLKTSPKQA